MKIFLIANNSGLRKEWWCEMNERFHINNDDFIVRFNRGILMNLFNKKTTQYFFREHSTGFHGINNNNIITNRCILNKHTIKFGILYWNKNPTPLFKTPLIEQQNSIILTEKILLSDSLVKLTGKSPSTGLVALLYFKKIYPDAKIYLMGFTFQNKIVNFHDFQKESVIITNIVKNNDNIHVIT